MALKQRWDSKREIILSYNPKYITDLSHRDSVLGDYLDIKPYRMNHFTDFFSWKLKAYNFYISEGRGRYFEI